MNTLDAIRTQSATRSDPSGSTASTAKDSLATKDTFLQLLVAQMRNQDPLQPTDGVQFLTQLAQFSSLEKSIELKDEVVNVRKAIEDLTALVKQQSTSSTGDTSA